MADEPFDFAAADGGGVISPFSAVMKDYSGDLWHIQSDLPHPLVMHARAVREFDRVAADLIRLAADEAFRSGVDPDRNPDFALVRVWQEVIYRATELFDTYVAHIPTALGSKADKQARRRLQPLVAAAKARRDPWALMCNRLKHNHHVLIPHRSRYASGKTVDGYRVSKHDHEGALRESMEFHKHIRSISFGVAVRELVHDILRTDQTAAKMVGGNAADGAAILAATLTSLHLLPPWPNIYETGQRSTVESGSGGFRLTRYLLESIPEDSRQTSVTTADGLTSVFEVP